jgi:signal transduction histidine kinase
VLPIFASRFNTGIVWIGTRSGLNRFDERKGTFTKFFHNTANPKNSLCGDYILSLHEDSEGNLWVGTRGNGLSKISFHSNSNPQFENFKHDPHDDSSISSNSIHSIYQDRNGKLWFGTGGGGLNFFNEDQKTFTKFITAENDSDGISGNWVYNIVEENSGKFWLGTAANGLNLFDPETKTFKHFQHDPKNVNSISSNRVLSILEMSTGEIWIGTALGLNKIVKPQNENDEYAFIKYFEKDGLPNDVIYGILEDDSSNLWISTNNGLCKLSLEEGKTAFRSYYTEDGLQSDEFDQNSFSKASDGKMYFGGIGGFNVFHPNSIKDNSFIPPIVITDFKIMNESVPIALDKKTNDKKNGANTFHLRKSISETDTIILSYRDDVISFEFAALNFTVSERNQYAYMMEGFDAGWIYSGSRRFVTYTNLDPGEYIFRVKGSNNDGIWNETGASIFIIVAPPPWATWWAYTIYTLLFFYGVYLFIKKREKTVKQEMEVALRIDKAKRDERESVRKKTSQDFHDEAGNKLTKIRLFTTLAKRENSDLALNKYLTQIEENTTELSNGMRDFLWVLDAGKDTLFDMIKRLEEFGNSMFEFSNTNYKVIGERHEFKKIILPMETRRTLILIFKEAMNNCLKYSEAQKVILNVELNNDILNLCLSDDGLGFNLEKISQGYGLKNMNARAESIKGELEILSEFNGGTKIIFKGNITHMGS